MRIPPSQAWDFIGWSSVHTVISKNQFWEIIDELKINGAEGILVCPIEKMVL